MDESKVTQLMRECQKVAELAIASGNSPFACIIATRDGEIIAREHNTQKSDNDPTAHAEIKALSKLGKKLGTRHLNDYILFANASSCAMCFAAALTARITIFYFGAPPEPRMDPWLTPEDIAARSQLDIQIHSQILGDECAAQIAAYRT